MNINTDNYYFNTQNAGHLCHGMAGKELINLALGSINDLVSQGDSFFSNSKPVDNNKNPLIHNTIRNIFKFSAFTYAGNLLLSQEGWQKPGHKLVKNLPKVNDVRNAWQPEDPTGNTLSFIFNYSLQSIKSTPQFIWSSGKLAAKTASLMPTLYRQISWQKLHNQWEEKALPKQYAEKMQQIEELLLKGIEGAPQNLMLTFSPEFFVAQLGDDKKTALELMEKGFNERSIEDKKLRKKLEKAITEGLKQPSIKELVNESLLLNKDFVALREEYSALTQKQADSLENQRIKEPFRPLFKRTLNSAISSASGLLGLTGTFSLLLSQRKGNDTTDKNDFINNLPLTPKSPVASSLRRISDLVDGSVDFGIKAGCGIYGSLKLWQLGRAIEKTVKREDGAKKHFSDFCSNLHIYALTLAAQDLVPSSITEMVDKLPGNQSAKSLTYWTLVSPALARGIYDLAALSFNFYKIRRAKSDEDKALFKERRARHWNGLKKVYSFSLLNFLAAPALKAQSSRIASGIDFAADSYQWNWRTAKKARMAGLKNMRELSDSSYTKACLPYSNKEILKAKETLNNKEVLNKKSILEAERVIGAKSRQEAVNHLVDLTHNPSQDNVKSAYSDLYDFFDTDPKAGKSQECQTLINRLFNSHPELACPDCSEELVEKINQANHFSKHPEELTKQIYRKLSLILHSDKLPSSLSDNSKNHIERIFSSLNKAYSSHVSKKGSDFIQENAQAPAA